MYEYTLSKAYPTNDSKNDRLALYHEMSAGSRYNDSIAAVNCRTGRFNDEDRMQPQLKQNSVGVPDGLNTDHIDLPLQMSQMKQELQDHTDMRMSLQSQQNTITYIKNTEASQDILDGGLRSPSHDMGADARQSLPGTHSKDRGNEKSRHNSDYQNVLEYSRPPD